MKSLKRNFFDGLAIVEKKKTSAKKMLEIFMTQMKFYPGFNELFQLFK